MGTGRLGRHFFRVPLQDHPALLVACQMMTEPLPCLPTSAARTNKDADATWCDHSKRKDVALKSTVYTGLPSPATKSTLCMCHCHALNLQLKLLVFSASEAFSSVLCCPTSLIFSMSPTRPSYAQGALNDSSKDVLNGWFQGHAGYPQTALNRFQTTSIYRQGSSLRSSSPRHQALRTRWRLPEILRKRSHHQGRPRRYRRRRCASRPD